MKFHDVEVTHAERVISDDITKGDVVAYYNDVAEVMLPELRRRALTMERFTKGLAAGGFFQKHAQKHYPPWIDRATLGGKTKVSYPVCDSARALVYFANQGGLAFHIWTSRVDAPTKPDVLVFDLDPPDGGFEMVRVTARLLEKTLGELALPAFVKTTGSKGLHVIAPLDGKDTFATVEKLAAAIAAKLTAQYPELLTTEFYKKDRKGRLFLDTMRNAPGATFVAAYSLRGKPHLPVSAPIAWSEVDDDALRPDRFTLRNVRARLEKRGDPWEKLRAHEGSAKAALAKLD
ncbi:MAG TPA: non-homologous end-joining DNA ligase [Kofleriaceae bacterium]|nr:non-homologous end-joining DNA ligase [Kofleriaceae bacterium]